MENSPYRRYNLYFYALQPSVNAFSVKLTVKFPRGYFV